MMSSICMLYDLYASMGQYRVLTSIRSGQVWGLNGTGISPPNINGVGTVVYNNGVPVPSTPTTDRNGQNPGTPGNTTPSQQQQQQNGQPGTPSQYNLQYGKMGGV